MRTLPSAMILLSCLMLLTMPDVSRAEDEGAAPEPRPGAGRGGGSRGGGSRMLERLKEMDTNGDGEISKEEFTGPSRMLDRLDKNGDGAISKSEIEARTRGGRGGGATGRRGGGSGLALDAVDANSDKRVSKTEMEAWFAKADKNGDGFVDAAEWVAASTGRQVVDPAPSVGSAAPSVQAKKLGRNEMRDLSKVSRTTVLIFGSHT